MAKLTDDQLRFIIDLDASGAQGEINTLTADISKLEKENKSLQKTIAANNKEIQDLTKQMSKLEKSGKQNTKEYQNLQKALTATRQNTAQLNAELTENNKKIEQNRQSVGQLTSSLKVSDMTMNQLRQRAKQLQQQLDMTSKSANPAQYKKLQGELQATTSRMGELNKKQSGLLDTLKSTMKGNLYAAAIIKTFQLLASAIRSVIQSHIEFEQKTATLAATLGKSKEEIRQLTDQAKELGRTTASTALEIVELQTALAKMGMTANEIEFSTAGIEQFATALGIDTKEAAESVSKALYNFNMDAYQTDKAVATLAAATRNSALTYDYLKQALDGVGPVANNFGFTLEDTVSLLAVFAKNGMRAGEAGQAAKNIILKLSDANSELAKQIGGPVRNMDDMIAALRKLQLEGTSLSDALELTDKRSAAAFRSLIQNTDALRDLRTQINDSGKALEQMANEQMNTVQGKTKELTSTWETFKQSLGLGGMGEAIAKDWLQGANNFLKMLTPAQKQVEKTVDDTISRMQAQYEQYYSNLRKMSYEDAQATEAIQRKTEDTIRQTAEWKIANAKDYFDRYGEYQNKQMEEEVEYYTKMLQLFETSQQERTKIIEQVRLIEQGEEKARQREAAKAAEERRKQRQKEAEERQRQLEQEAEERRKLNEQQYREDLDNAREFFEEQMLLLKQQYADRQMTDDEFRQHAFNLEMQHLEALKQIQEEYGDSTVQTDERIADLRIKINEETDRLIAQAQKEANEALKEQLKETQDIFKELEGIIKDISSNIGSGLGGDLLSNFEKATKGVQKMMQALQSDTASQSEKIGASIAGIASVASAAMSQVSQITSAWFELETATLEAEKQKQLTIAGDNAEEREKVEQEYAQKELDLKKKQADADAGVQSAQLWINTAMGVASAWASCMQLGPIAGPIAASILTGGLLATAGIEEAIILKNRDAIKNTTLESPQTASEASSAASSASSVSTNSTYTLKKEYSDGYADGGFTGEGDKFEPAGIVHRGEYVVPQAEMKNPVVVPMVRKIEAIRTARLAGRGTAADTYGYADGGYVEPAATGAGVQSSDDERLARTLSRLALILEQLQRQPLRATVNYRELESAGQKMNKIKSKL